MVVSLGIGKKGPPVLHQTLPRSRLPLLAADVIPLWHFYIVSAVPLYSFGR